MLGSMSAERWHVHAVRLPDGDRPDDVWIVDGRITDDPQPDWDDLPGGWALTGLVDAHAHLSLDFSETGLTGEALLARNRQAHLGRGVTHLRDIGALPGVFVGGPRVQAAGRFIAPTGGYIPELFEPTARDETVATALAQLERGATWVKLISDFPHSMRFEEAIDAPPNYDEDELRAVVDAVHAAGGRVAVHATSASVGAAVRAGV